MYLVHTKLGLRTVEHFSERIRSKDGLYYIEDSFNVTEWLHIELFVEARQTSLFQCCLGSLCESDLIVSASTKPMANEFSVRVSSESVHSMCCGKVSSLAFADSDIHTRSKSSTFEKTVFLIFDRWRVAVPSWSSMLSRLWIWQFVKVCRYFSGYVTGSIMERLSPLCGLRSGRGSLRKYFDLD